MAFSVLSKKRLYSLSVSFLLFLSLPSGISQDAVPGKRPYQSFGDLRIAFPGHTRYSNYYRELSLDSARVMVRYEVDGVQYQRETITSFTDQVVMVRLTANRPGQITFNAQLTSPHQDVMIASEAGNCVTLSGVSSLHEGLKGKVEFQGRLTAKNKGGEIACADGILSVEKADEAIIYLLRLISIIIKTLPVIK